MINDFYKAVARLRVVTVNSVLERSKRSPEQVRASFDKELTRIANSIQKGYTLGPRRMTAMQELYRPYKYVDLTMNIFNHPELDFTHPSIRWRDVYKPSYPPEIAIIIKRGSEKLKVTDEDIGKLLSWCTAWKTRKPETLEECNDDEFYKRWW